MARIEAMQRELAPGGADGAGGAEDASKDAFTLQKTEIYFGLEDVSTAMREICLWRHSCHCAVQSLPVAIRSSGLLGRIQSESSVETFKTPEHAFRIEETP